jgi:hypothetical protein
MLAAAAALAAGIAGGLLRADALHPGLAGVAPFGAAVVSHAALMVCAFFGTVIGIERAVALGRGWAFLAPALAGAGGIAILLGGHRTAAGSFVAAAAAFVAVNIAVVGRQRAPHTVLLLAAAIAWLAGAVLHFWRPGGPATIEFWFAFLVATIAAERLELTRLMPRRPGSGAILLAATSGLVAGAAVSAFAPRWGGTVHGLSLVILAGWGLAFDIARRTIATEGASRYMAACLLAGYGWLGIGGFAWVAVAWGASGARDAALHAIGLGFVFDMVMAHALVILPAVARIRVAWGPVFYLGFALMQASLALRLAGPPLGLDLRAAGSLLNAIAILVFVLTIAGMALRARRAPPGRRGYSA